MTEQDWNGIIAKQNNKCACCGISFGTKRQVDTPVVDHCHNTGDVREIICERCNIGLGLLYDDWERAKVLLRYLEKHRK